ncbi:hypothetical protein ACEPAI_9252 [Sanghuangporus weigelae]
MPFAWKNPKGKDSIEKRRERGEISCAECRRHKLKCNKVIPCSTCIRKGCQEICPNGTLSPSNLTRNALRGKDVRLQRLMQMSRRIRELEDALQIAHSSATGSARHPLLSEDLLRIKNHLEQPPPATREAGEPDEDIVDSFGTLSILERGVETYIGADESVLKLGAAGGMQYRMHSSLMSPTSYPREAFPFSPLYLPTQEIRERTQEKLPSFERASALVEAYLENTSWFVKTVDREQIMEELLPLFYKKRSSSSGNVQADPHSLTLLFAIFACGAVADLTLPPWNEEADLYYRLAWMGFSLRSIFDGTSLQTIQALAIIASYDIFSCRRNSLEGTCKMISYSMSLAVSVSFFLPSPRRAVLTTIHRTDRLTDPTHFKLPPKQVKRRRLLFWGLYTMDAWKSVGTGRPMSIHPSVIDCELPEDMDATFTEDGTKLPSVWEIQYQFSKEVMADVVDKLCSARALKYSEILNVDQKIREFGKDKIFSPTTNISPDGSTQSALRRLLLIMIKESPLLLLHRNFFVRALIENPADPTKSRFAPSFLTAYLSAVKILRALEGLMNDCGHFVVRIWPIWSHALSATVLLGTVAACGTSSALAPQAFTEFSLSVNMLERVQIHPIVKELLPSVLHLRDRAYEALSNYGNNGSSLQSLIPNRPPVLDDENRLTVVNGTGVMPQSELGVINNTSKLISEYSHSSTSTTSAGLLDNVRPGSVAQQSSAVCGNRSRPRSLSHSQPSPVENASFPLGGQSLGDPSLSGKISGSQNLAHQSLQYRDAQVIPGNPRSQVIGPSALHLPPETYSNSRERSDLRHRTETLNGLHASFNAELEAFPSDLSNGELAETLTDPFDSPFSFDSLSTFPTGSFFDTDFDVSYNMRSSTGDESILPLISEDLAPCRTILEDSRFFGYGVAASDQESQSGGGGPF